jgi:hypothetical protein
MGALEESFELVLGSEADDTWNLADLYRLVGQGALRELDAHVLYLFADGFSRGCPESKLHAAPATPGFANDVGRRDPRRGAYAYEFAHLRDKGVWLQLKASA